MALWAIELSEFDIQYRPRTTIKGQVGADFIAEFTHDEGEGQKNLFSGAYIETDHLTSRSGGPASYYGHLKEIWLNAWSVSTSLPLTMEQNTKH